MKKSTIYLARFNKSDPLAQSHAKIDKLFLTANIGQTIAPSDLTAVKVHFGEEGNTTYLPATFITPIISQVKQAGGKPFVTDTNVLYKSTRDNAVDHLHLAAEHGFSLNTLGAPIVIADGIAGRNEIDVEINAPLNKSVSLASDFVTSNSLVVVTHATGHLATGLGATIKNLGMGMASRKGKLRQHSVSHPMIVESMCSGCKNCSKWCPTDAIEMQQESKAFIVDEKCIGCGECLAICRQDAVKFRWDTSSELLQQQIAEHALGIAMAKAGKIAYFTFLINMTKDCDCLKQKEVFLLDDIGVIAGFDPVALDQAVIDLTTTDRQKNLATLSYPQLDCTKQLSYGEQIGLGSRDYNLVEIDD
ncbi:MAG: DUF362 domain-containing protein [Bacteriovoracaceae bacterium]|nr:DUF362 domain-containing protein [Bacteriovoracaceae bacterium]